MSHSGIAAIEMLAVKVPADKLGLSLRKMMAAPKSESCRVMKTDLGADAENDCKVRVFPFRALPIEVSVLNRPVLARSNVRFGKIAAPQRSLCIEREQMLREHFLCERLAAKSARQTLTFR